jgi:serine protease
MRLVHESSPSSLVAIAVVLAAAALGAQDRSDARIERSPLGERFANAPAARPARHEDRVLVSFDIKVDHRQLDAALRGVGARWRESGQHGGFEVIEVPEGTVDAWVAFLRRQDAVVSAEPDHVAYTCEEPNDTFFKPYQWNLYDQGVLSNGVPSNFGVRAMSAWNTTKGGNITVAIVDTGVAYEKYSRFEKAPDLAGATIVSPYNFVAKTTHANDDNGHGTHVCGTVRQSTGNNLGCAGIASQCRIMPVKVLNSAGSGSYSAIADGIIWAADHGADVINLSLGGASGSAVLQSAVDYAWSKGVVICAAAGNSGAATVGYPAKYVNCIAIGATRFDGKRCAYSQYGADLDVVAPGGDTSVDQNGDGYGDGILQQTFSGSTKNFGYYFFQGTSMATPHVAAIAALVKANKPAYTAAQVRNAIQGSCLDLGAGGFDAEYGWGLVNAADALTR